MWQGVQKTVLSGNMIENFDNDDNSSSNTNNNDDDNNRKIYIFVYHLLQNDL